MLRAKKKNTKEIFYIMEINVKFCFLFRKPELWGFRILTEKLSACNNPRLCSTRCHKNGNHLCLCFCNSLDNLDIYNHTVRIYGTIVEF